jgi:hypothetical protein
MLSSRQSNYVSISKPRDALLVFSPLK